MKEELTQIALSQKAAVVVTSSSMLSWFASLWGWVDANITKVSAIASFILIVVMAVTNTCASIRQNREHKSTMRERELKIEMLQRQLNGEKDD
jgi:uncharacterized membrane protein